MSSSWLLRDSHGRGCAPSSSVEIFGALSNPEVQERLEKLSATLAKVEAAGAARRPSRFTSKRRAGLLTRTIEQVLAEAESPMRMYEIHTAAEELIGEAVPRSSVKNCLANNCRGERARFVRLERGRYQLPM
jgi:hypothetical protein